MATNAMAAARAASPTPCPPHQTRLSSEAPMSCSVDNPRFSLRLPLSKNGQPGPLQPLQLRLSCQPFWKCRNPASTCHSLP